MSINYVNIYKKWNRQPAIKTNLLKCRSCHLSSNFWLCGSGGNNNAVDHSKNYQHHLVVKLRTITSDGKGDVFCYKFEDEVVDNFLQEHLANYGIEIEKQVISEKTTAELTLNVNLILKLNKLYDIWT